MAQDVKFGVFVAPQFSWFSPEAKDVESDGLIAGFSGGLNIDNYFAENYAFATGINIGGQGGKLNYSETSNNTLTVYDSTYSLAGNTVKYKQQYVSVPLGIKLRSNEIGYLKFHVVLGFTNQFNIKTTVTDETNDNFNDDSIKDEINFYNLGYHFGGGIDYAIGEDTSLFLTVVYDNGFLDITKSSLQVNSRIISIRAGITF
jgi:hypothetical protein